MRVLPLLFALFAAVAALADEHRVCVYRGSIVSTAQQATASRPVQVTQRGWLIVNWLDTAPAQDGGWQTFARVTLVAIAGDGTVTRSDYAVELDAARAPFVLVPQPSPARGLLMAERLAGGWEALMLKGVDSPFAAGPATWEVPLRLEGRSLAHATEHGQSATNARYAFRLDPVRTRLAATMADGASAFAAAVATIEAASQPDL